MTGFVPMQELRDQSGLRRKSAIVAWLKRHGVNPMISANGEPVVTWDALTAAMLPQAQTVAAPKLRLPGRHGQTA
ncbi:MAG: DUF4224 domain-containing protein [Lysobacterales bacterium]